MRRVFRRSARDRCQGLHTSDRVLEYLWWTKGIIGKCGPTAPYHLVVRNIDAVASASKLLASGVIWVCAVYCWSGPWRRSVDSYHFLKQLLFRPSLRVMKVELTLTQKCKRFKICEEYYVKFCIVSTIIRLFFVHIMKCFIMKPIEDCITTWRLFWSRTPTYCIL